MRALAVCLALVTLIACLLKEPRKIGVLHVFTAISQCAEGKQAFGEFEKKVTARKKN